MHLLDLARMVQADRLRETENFRRGNQPRLHRPSRPRARLRWTRHLPDNTQGDQR
jgi:hypothetical protein